MTSFNVSIKGQKKLEDKIKKMSNPNKFFNSDVRNTAIKSQRELIEKTNKKTGTTARSWQLKKVKDGVYINFNDVMTDDKEHVIVSILNEGRGEVLPVKAKMLYIPLTETGRARSGKFGIDFIFAKRAKPYKGTQFINTEEKRAIKQLVKLMLRRIRRS